MNFVVVVDVNLFLTILRKCKLNFVSASEDRPYFCSIVLLLSKKIIQTTKLICQLLECNIFTYHVYWYGKKIRKIQIRVQRPSVTICLRTRILIFLHYESTVLFKNFIHYHSLYMQHNTIAHANILSTFVNLSDELCCCG